MSLGLPSTNLFFTQTRLFRPPLLLPGQGLHIMTIGINRPVKRNSVNTETSEALKLAFQVASLRLTLTDGVLL